MSNPEEIVIPIAVFTAILIFVGILLMHSLSKKRLFLKFVGQHNDLSPDSINAIGRILFSANNDMRKGVFSLLLAFAVWGFSFILKSAVDPESLSVQSELVVLYR